jgi:uncharacterized protein with HEPN domain
MLQPKDRIRLQHMLDHATEALNMIKGRTREDLDIDRQLNLSLVRLLEIVGEAASRTSESTRSSHSELPWVQIISLRNRLIHGYDEVDFDILWTILQEDLPPLVTQLKQSLSDPL